MEIINKFVDFYKYCKDCKHLEEKETDEPCNTCLDNPVNLHSQKPVKFEENKNKKK